MQIAPEPTGTETTRRTRSPRRAGVVAAAVAAGLLLASCSVPSNAPEAYSDAVQANFVTGCTGDIPETDGTTTSLAPSDYCTCAYGVFERLMPFNDDERTDSQYSGYPADAPVFTTFNSDLSSSDDPASVWAKLPATITDELASCPLGAGPLSPTTTAAPASNESTTTTAAP